jgi:hypothetical protein
MSAANEISVKHNRLGRRSGLSSQVSLSKKSFFDPPATRVSSRMRDVQRCVLLAATSSPTLHISKHTCPRQAPKNAPAIQYGNERFDVTVKAAVTRSPRLRASPLDWRPNSYNSKSPSLKCCQQRPHGIAIFLPGFGCQHFVGDQVGMKLQIIIAGRSKTPSC